MELFHTIVLVIGLAMITYAIYKISKMDDAYDTK